MYLNNWSKLLNISKILAKLKAILKTCLLNAGYLISMSNNPQEIRPLQPKQLNILYRYLRF